MTEVVLDAPVVMKWFRADGERQQPARSLRAAFESGELIVFAAPLLCLEIVNVAGRRWRWPESALLELAGALDDLGFELIEPELTRVAYWTARGLTAYDAAYVAVAEAEGTRLVTDDLSVRGRSRGAHGSEHPRRMTDTAYLRSKWAEPGIAQTTSRRVRRRR